MKSLRIVLAFFAMALVMPAARAVTGSMWLIPKDDTTKVYYITDANYKPTTLQSTALAGCTDSSGNLKKAILISVPSPALQHIAASFDGDVWGIGVGGTSLHHLYGTDKCPAGSAWDASGDKAGAQAWVSVGLPSLASGDTLKELAVNAGKVFALSTNGKIYQRIGLDGSYDGTGWQAVSFNNVMIGTTSYANDANNEKYPIECIAVGPKTGRLWGVIRYAFRTSEPKYSMVYFGDDLTTATEYMGAWTDWRQLVHSLVNDTANLSGDKFLLRVHVGSDPANGAGSAWYVDPGSKSWTVLSSSSKFLSVALAPDDQAWGIDQYYYLYYWGSSSWSKYISSTQFTQFSIGYWGYGRLGYGDGKADAAAGTARKITFTAPYNTTDYQDGYYKGYEEGAPQSLWGITPAGKVLQFSSADIPKKASGTISAAAITTLFEKSVADGSTDVTSQKIVLTDAKVVVTGSDGDVWALAGGKVYHRHGTETTPRGDSWVEVPSPTDITFTNLAVNAGKVFGFVLVGDGKAGGSKIYQRTGLDASYDGTSWEEVIPTTFPSTLYHNSSSVAFKGHGYYRGIAVGSVTGRLWALCLCASGHWHKCYFSDDLKIVREWAVNATDYVLGSLNDTDQLVVLEDPSTIPTATTTSLIRAFCWRNLSNWIHYLKEPANAANQISNTSTSLYGKYVCYTAQQAKPDINSWWFVGTGNDLFNTRSREGNLFDRITPPDTSIITTISACYWNKAARQARIDGIQKAAVEAQDKANGKDDGITAGSRAGLAQPQPTVVDATKSDAYKTAYTNAYIDAYIQALGSTAAGWQALGQAHGKTATATITADTALASLGAARNAAPFNTYVEAYKTTLLGIYVDAYNAAYNDAVAAAKLDAEKNKPTPSTTTKTSGTGTRTGTGTGSGTGTGTGTGTGGTPGTVTKLLSGAALGKTNGDKDAVGQKEPFASGRGDKAYTDAYKKAYTARVNKGGTQAWQKLGVTHAKTDIVAAQGVMQTQQALDQQVIAQAKQFDGFGVTQANLNVYKYAYDGTIDGNNAAVNDKAKKAKKNPTAKAGTTKTYKDAYAVAYKAVYK